MATPLFTRWFQAQAFAPGFRFQQSSDDSAPWQGPAQTQRALVELIRLRLRLAPYIDSTGVDQTLEQACAKPHAQAVPASLGDYARSASHLHALSFGPSIWVQPAPPVATETLRVALPAGSGWIDFWTGAAHSGEQTIRTPAPLDRIPIFVRAGSIVPLATLDDETGELSDPLDICIYPGADGVFTLLETPASRITGARPTIAFVWDDRARTLRIGARSGKAGATIPRRRFKILVMRPGGGFADLQASRPDIEVDYEGAELRLSLPPVPSRPPAPRGLTATVQGANMVLTWQTPCANALYRLRRTTGLDGPGEDLASALSAPRHVIPLSVCQQPFDCVVTAMNGGGESLPSAAITVTHPFAAAASKSEPASRLGTTANTRVAWPQAQARVAASPRPAINDAAARARLQRLGISPAARPVAR